MKRRDFIKSTLLTGAGLYLGDQVWAPSFVHAAIPGSHKRTLLNITLRGGPDFRHLIVPPFDKDPASYGYAYWSNRWRAHNVGSTAAAWEKRYKAAYTPMEVGGVRFGLLAKAGWLKKQIEAGRVAMINNVAAATTRNHAHALIVYESGDRKATSNDLTRDGWGGRLAKVTGGRVVSMTRIVRLFCNGPHPTDKTQHDNGHVISAVNSRKISMYHAPELASDPGSKGTRAVLSRALSSYYAAKSKELAKTSVFHPFVEHEKILRSFGALVEARLKEVTLPKTISDLYEVTDKLKRVSFGKQMRNAYDSFACADIFGFRVGSLVYDGWDSHRDQSTAIEPQFADIFGTGLGLDSLFTELASTMPSAVPATVAVIGGEFGRQLRDNGDGGTDHGRGNMTLVIGSSVNGGVYGELFPKAEIASYAKPSSDITGQTAIEHVYGAVCDWIHKGAGATVFPGSSGAPKEKGVDLTKLFKA